MIVAISEEEVLKLCRQALGLPLAAAPLIDNSFLAASVRRAAGILCPCSRSTLAAAVVESLQLITEDKCELRDQVDSALETLIVFGDLLELAQVSIDDPEAKGTWVFAAPPGFVVTSGGSVYIIGIVRDEPTPLPESLASRVVHEGFTRAIRPELGENLSEIMCEMGMRKISIEAWLKAPTYKPFDRMLSSMFQLLAAQPPSGPVDGLRILDSARSVDYYRGRWVEPGEEHSGSFIARRPQEYGDALWAVVMLKEGTVVRFLDLPLRGTRWRGCDVAWHLQMAIDRDRGIPQFYRRRLTSDGALLDFFSPLPLWAERRLAALGSRTSRVQSLFSYSLPEVELSSVEQFLQEHLWLERHKGL